jgi:hypothetical protein
MIRPEEKTNLSRLMQWIMSVFAMAYNRIHGLVGHVWGSRFYSRIVSGLREFLKMFKYIDDNPVVSHQVEEKQAWRFGGLWHHRAGIVELCSPLQLFLELTFPEHKQIMLVGSIESPPQAGAVTWRILAPVEAVLSKEILIDTTVPLRSSCH